MREKTSLAVSDKDRAAPAKFEQAAESPAAARPQCDAPVVQKLTTKRRAILDKLIRLIEGLPDEHLHRLSGYAGGLLCSYISTKNQRTAVVLRFPKKKARAAA